MAIQSTNHVLMILPSVGVNSSRASENTSESARANARAITKFAMGCAAKRASLPLKYVLYSKTKTAGGLRETKVSSKCDDVGSRNRVAR